MNIYVNVSFVKVVLKPCSFDIMSKDLITSVIVYQIVE